MAALRTKYIVYEFVGDDRHEVSAHWLIERAKSVATAHANKTGNVVSLDIDEGYQTGQGWQVEFSDPDAWLFNPATKAVK